MAQAQPVKAVTFDAAGTLIRVAEPVGESYARVAHGLGAQLSPERLDAGFRSAFAQMPPMAFAVMDDASRLRCERAWWRTLVARVVDHAGGIAAFDQYFDALFAYYASGAAWRAYPEVHEVLRTVRARGMRLAVISNFDARLVPILRELDLADRVDAVIYSTACASAKPDAGVFKHALERIAVSPENALHVGDNLDADYRGAVAAGMAAVHLDRRAGAAATGVPTIGDLSELDQYYD